MELRQIRTFVTVTQTESFSKAAELLGYSQSAVTVQIRLLEEELGVKLFERMSRKVFLTSSGRTFLTHAVRILRETEKARESVMLTGELSGKLHIGTLESLCYSKLPEIMERFRREHPKVRIKIATGEPKELIHMMEKDRLDIIYILDRPRFHENWVKAVESREPVVFVASAAYGWGPGKKICLHELLEEPFFLTEKDENYRRELDSFLEKNGRQITPFLESGSTEFIIRMLEKNRGISYLPLFSVRESALQGKLTVLDVEGLKIEMQGQVIYHKNKWLTGEMQEFIRILSESEGVENMSRFHSTGEP